MSGPNAQSVGNANMPFLGQSAGGQIRQWVGHINVESSELAVVGVTGKKNDATRIGVADELEEPCLITREVRPRFPTGKISKHLQAGTYQPQIGGLAKLLVQPRPLRGTEHGRLWRGIAGIGPRYLSLGARFLLGPAAVDLVIGKCGVTGDGCPIPA